MATFLFFRSKCFCFLVFLFFLVIFVVYRLKKGFSNIVEEGTACQKNKLSFFAPQSMRHCFRLHHFSSNSGFQWAEKSRTVPARSSVERFVVSRYKKRGRKTAANILHPHFSLCDSSARRKPSKNHGVKVWLDVKRNVWCYIMFPGGKKLSRYWNVGVSSRKPVLLVKK